MPRSDEAQAPLPSSPPPKADSNQQQSNASYSSTLEKEPPNPSPLSNHPATTTLNLKNTSPPTTPTTSLEPIPLATLLKLKPKSIDSEDGIYQTLVKLRQQTLTPPLDTADADVDKMDTPKTSKPTSDSVNQTMQRPVTWNDTQLEHFQSKRPHAEAECEICTEKLIILKEFDVLFLKRTFVKLDTKGQGFITQDEMKVVLIQWRKYTDTTYFETFIIVEDGRINYEKLLDVVTSTNYCQTLCLCRPTRWIHNKCLTQKLTMGLNGTGGYLLRCGFCRASVWGTQYVQWLAKAQRLLHEAIGAEKHIAMKNANEALSLSVNTMHAVIQCGGGTIRQNPILGECLATVGSAIYKHQHASNGGYPTNDYSAQICLKAMQMMGPPSLRVAWIMSEMRWVLKEEDQEPEKIQWLNLAVKYCKEAKCGIPLNQHVLHMRAECMLLKFMVFYPFVKLDEVMEAIQAWPWEIDVLNTDTCFLVCSVMAAHFGVRHMGTVTRKYYERGILLDPILFEELKIKLDLQMHDDIVWMNTITMNITVTDEDRVKLGDEWDWEKHMLDNEVIKRLIQAYNTLHQYEKAAMWQEVLEVL